jgi:hypothetical protein
VESKYTGRADFKKIKKNKKEDLELLKWKEITSSSFCIQPRSSDGCTNLFTSNNISSVT